MSKLNWYQKMRRRQAFFAGATEGEEMKTDADYAEIRKAGQEAGAMGLNSYQLEAAWDDYMHKHEDDYFEVDDPQENPDSADAELVDMDEDEDFDDVGAEV